jgi:hypothetical protein
LNFSLHQPKHRLGWGRLINLHPSLGKAASAHTTTLVFLFLNKQSFATLQGLRPIAHAYNSLQFMFCLYDFKLFYLFFNTNETFIAESMTSSTV